MKRYVALGALIAALVLVLAGCAGVSGDDQNAPIKFGAFMPITGAVANPSNQDAVALAEKAINARGGIRGRQVHIEVYDVGDTPESAVNAVNRALSDGIKFAFGFANSPQVLATASLFQDSSVPLLSFAISSALDFGKTNNPWLFRMLPAAGPLVGRGMDYLAKQLGVSRFAAVTTSDEGSKASLPLMENYVKNQLGGQVVDSVAFSPQATDTTSEVLNIKQSGAQGMYLWGFPQPSSVLIRQLRQSGSNIPIMLDYGGSFQISNKLSAPQVLDHVYSAAACPVDLLPSAKDVYDQLTQKTKVDTYTGLFYDAAFVYKTVVESTGSTDGTTIQKGLTSPNSLQFTGVCGPYRGAANHDIADFGVILSLADGKLTMADKQ